MELNAGSFEKTGITSTSAQPFIGSRQAEARSFTRNRAAVGSLIYLMLIIVCSILLPMLSRYSISEQDLTGTYLKPFTNGHIFGTDELGRDLWVRVWYGGRISLFIGVMAVLVDFFIGVVYGGISGYFGGKIDTIMMRIVDILIALPYMMVVILLTVVMQPGVLTIIAALSITGWTTMARLVRGQVMQLKEQEFVLAARVLGASPVRVIARHILPNIIGIVIASMTLTIPGAILAEAFLSYLGLGVRLPTPSWGTLASDGAAAFHAYPWVLFIPAAFICLTMLSLNILGDALRDALDPTFRKQG